MNFFAELKRRNVFKVGIAYAITSWLLIQVTDILLESIGAPPWVMQTMFVVLAVGFIIALFFAWAFELTPEGVKKEKDVDRSESITPQTGRKLDPEFELYGSQDFELLNGDLLAAEKIALASIPAAENTDQKEIILKASFTALRDPTRTDWAVSTILANREQVQRYVIFNELYRLGAIDETINIWREARENGRGLQAANMLSTLWAAYDRKQLSNPSMPGLFEESGLADYWRQHGNPDYCRVDGKHIECDKP